MWFIAVATIALAQGGIVLPIAVGQTVEEPVDNAIGWFCDDPSLISAEIVTRGAFNDWRVTGVKAGTTQCRVGTELGRASYLFDVTVIERR